MKFGIYIYMCVYVGVCIYLFLNLFFVCLLCVYIYIHTTISSI